MRFIKKWLNNIITNWGEAYKDVGFRKYALPNFVVCLSCYYAVIYWVSINSTRPGALLHDPFYPFLPYHDYSLFIFILTYTATFVLLFDVAQYPYLLHRAFTTFVAVFFIRGICIHLIPLSPSPDLIPLLDPITNTLAGEGHITNDLFFSGHVADLTTFYLLCQNPWRKRYILLSVCIVGVLLVCQHVHYTADVIAAPFFSYCGYKLFVEKDLIWKPFLKQQQAVYNQDPLSVG